METTSFQLWPGGESYAFRGDIYDLKGRRLQGGTFKGAEWRKGTAEEWRKIEIEHLARIYSERDILCCDSALVDELIKAAGDGRGELAEAFSYDEIRGLYKDPSDWGFQECWDYLSEYGLDMPDPNPQQMYSDNDRAAMVELLESVSIACRDDESLETLRDAIIANIDDETIDGIDDWREACREYTQNPAEVFEWWRVTSWLCGQLDTIGEVTIDNGYGCWWGRTCTGQGYLMDGTLQTVAAQFVKDGGE